MKIRFILLAMFLINLTVNAQEPTFKDDFHDNFRQWLTGETEDYKNDVTDGHYVIKHKNESGGRYFWKNMIMDPSKDFTITSRIKQKAGVEDNGYGLLWGTLNANNSYLFAITTNGYFKVTQYVEGEFKAFQKWKKIKNINRKGEYNDLKIVREGKKLFFYVNGEQVYSMKFVPFFGQNVGFAVHDNMEIMVDEIEIQVEGMPFLLVDNPINNFVKENLGENVNSTASEKAPKISADGKTLIYTRSEHPENVENPDKDDIWLSELDKDGNWTKSINMGFPLNNSGNNSVISMSPDLNTMYIMNTYKSDGTPYSSGISRSDRTVSGWTVPETIEIEDYYNNSDYSEFCMSSNKKTLVMTIEMKDTRGDKDIYVSFEKNGKYTKPMNIGSVVNSYNNESSPFLASDDRSLYFSSNGHPGYGSNDIFMTKRLDDTWLNWSAPKNLGPEINSAEWDAYYTLPASGNYAYLISYENAIGEGDIFRVKPPEASKPDPVVLIFGKVINKKTNEPMQASISYNDLKTDTEKGSATSDPSTGEYRIILPYGTNYSFRAMQQGFYPTSDNLDVSTLDHYTEIERDLYLSPIEVGETIRLNNIFFDLDKATLKEESFSELNRLVQLLKDNSKMTIKIQGHTDNQGSDAYNKKLSEDRVNTVIQYLITNGVETERLTGEGFGESNPVATNDTDEGKAINRRVEFTIVKK